MKTWVSFAAVLVLCVVPARAQQQASETSEIELLRLEQDVDKTLLQEALLALGRKSMSQTPDRPGPDAAKQREQETAALVKFIDEKKDAYKRRADELKQKREEFSASRRSQSRPPAGTVVTTGDKAQQELIEKLEDAQVEVQLLQIQTQLYQQPLNEALQALANAEFAASNDPTQQAQADAARKRFESAKTKYVGFSKKIQSAQSKVGELQRGLGMAGMGGMGGGFR